MSAKSIFIKLPRVRYSKMDDHQLIESYRTKHDEAIIDELFNRYIHLIFPLCYKYFKDESSAKDAAIEAFASLGEKLLKFEITNFKSWLYTVARNHCLMKLRKDTKEVVTDNIDIFQGYIVERPVFLHQEDEQEEKAVKLVGLMTKLKDGQKVCLELMYFQNMSYKQISDATGYTLKQVKSFIQNGKRNLRILFEGEK